MRHGFASPRAIVTPDAAFKAPARSRLASGPSNRLLQPKPRVGPVNDPLEREADRVADAVIAGAPLPAVGAAAGVQAKCAECEAEGETIRRETTEEEDETIQTKAEAGGPAKAGAAQAAAALASGGAPLSADTRAYFEPRFGRDLSDVRVHASGTADQAARSINARAYTLGRNVAFASGEYAPGTHAGRHLIAHELAHVVQQSDAATPEIRREVRDCKSDDGTVAAAASQASADLGKALAVLNERPVSAHAKTALWLAFRDDSDATLDLVTRAVDILKARSGRTDFACAPASEPSCVRGDNGYVQGASVYCPENPGPEGRTALDDQTVYLCMGSFKSLTLPQQAGVIIHEIAHLGLNACDMGYFDNLCHETVEKEPPTGETSAPRGRLSGTRGDSTADRIRNADAFACLTRFLAHESNAQLGTRVGTFRGDAVSITADSDSIYTGARFDDWPVFRLAGIPDHSGFMFRWYLLADGVKMKLTSSKGPTHVLTREVTDVTVSHRTRGILADAGVENVTIVCEIQLFEMLQGEKEPQIIRKTFDAPVKPGVDHSDPRSAIP
jgi:hypothetical protein